MNKPTLLIIALSVSTTAACGDHDNPPDDSADSNLIVQVNALSLEGVSDACYDLQITNAAGETITEALDICSSAYGDGRGSMSYVGTCDAADGGTNQVALTLKSLTSDSGAEIDPADYSNPCPPGAPCVLETECVDNADTLVVFDLTILRRLGAGFFDVAVNFEDIFCSAKVDCATEAGDPIELLFGQGVRQPTVVLGFACSGGGDTVSLYRDPLNIDCGPDGTYSLDPMSTGELGGFGRWEVYTGASAPTGSNPVTTAFWNIGLAVDPGFTGACTLSTTATATDDVDPDGTVAAGYPLIQADVQIFEGSNIPVCGQNALDAPDSGVRVGLSSGTRTFDAVYSAR